VKGVGSERAYQCLTESLQTLGGSGFLQDYPIEQYIRDAKIDSLYEGTTAIQAQDFFFRKIARDQGRALQHVVGQIQQFLASDTARAELADARALLGNAMVDLQGMVAAMTGYLLGAQENAKELYRIGLESVAFLLAVGDLLIGWLLLQQAEIALNALDADVSEKDRAFYTGKIAAAKFFVENVLPRLAAERKIVESVDLAIMELREDAF
jgi:Acetyl-CoA dehydrogenase C-terminal like/Acyl-CoA dehydrogenase, C-terminal domain